MNRFVMNKIDMSCIVYTKYILWYLMHIMKTYIMVQTLVRDWY